MDPVPVVMSILFVNPVVALLMASRLRLTTLDGIGNSWPIHETNKFCFPLGVGGKRRCVFAAASEGERPTATADPMPDSSSFFFLYIAVVVCLRSRNDKGKNEKGIQIF